jgi:hypothetical protein
MIQEANLHWRYVDTESNLILPWYTLPCLHWLKTLNVSQWRVFEYGCGYSTIWWALNCEKVKSVDSNYEWSRAMLAVYVEDEYNYVESISFGFDSPYDCIIVDGSYRENCVNNCLEHLKQNGYLIIDNWGQEDFPVDACDRTLELLKDWPYKLFPQPNHSTWVTAVFVKP